LETGAIAVSVTVIEAKKQNSALHDAFLFLLRLTQQSITLWLWDVRTRSSQELIKATSWFLLHWSTFVTASNNKHSLSKPHLRQIIGHNLICAWRQLK
jgi:hypothetical protein